MMRLDIGAGANKLPGYTTVDLYAPADIKDDIRTLKTIPSNSIDHVNTAHILEHIALDDIPNVFKAVHRVLKPQGSWHIEVPDLVWLFANFLDTPEDKRWGWKIQTIFGLQNHEGEFHRSGYTQERLGNLLIDHGFTNIKVRAEYSKTYNQGVLIADANKP